MDERAIKKKLDELKIEDEDNLHANLIKDVLNKGVAEGLSNYSSDIALAKMRQLTERLKQLELNKQKEKVTQKLTKDQIDQLISEKLIELKIFNEDHFHSRIIASVWNKGVVAALEEQKENIALKKFQNLMEMLEPLQKQINARIILQVLERLKINNEKETSHDKIVDVVLENGAQAINQFAEVISPKKMEQLVYELKKLPTSIKPTVERRVLTLSYQIDFNCFNALDSSKSIHVDFHEAAKQSFGQPHFAEVIARRMIYLIKRQQDLRGFIEDMHTSVTGSETISLRQLLCEFLINCSDDVRVKCYQLLSANNPVPAIIDQGGEFFTIESYWIAMDAIKSIDSSDTSTTTRILSCGLESTCKGKSKLLNTLFSTSFEENEYADDCFFNGTIDMQMVRNFGTPDNHLYIADAHGVVCEALLQKMADLFDVIIVHLNESSCHLVKYIELLGKLASLVHKRLFVIVRDSKSVSRENCCNQQNLKRTLGQLADIVKSVHGERIRFCSVPLLEKENQAKLFGSNLRVFIYDELFSDDIMKEVSTFN